MRIWRGDLKRGANAETNLVKLHSKTECKLVYSTIKFEIFHDEMCFHWNNICYLLMKGELFVKTKEDIFNWQIYRESMQFKSYRYMWLWNNTKYPFQKYCLWTNTMAQKYKDKVPCLKVYTKYVNESIDFHQSQ